MLTRVLLCGMGLIALQIGSGIAQKGVAQTLASRSDTPVIDKPMAIDKTSRAPGDIPEIIRESDIDRVQGRGKATADPSAVLTPPTVSPTFLRSIRLDWDQLGRGREVTSR